LNDLQFTPNYAKGMAVIVLPQKKFILMSSLYVLKQVIPISTSPFSTAAISECKWKKLYFQSPSKTHGIFILINILLLLFQLL